MRTRPTLLLALVASCAALRCAEDRTFSGGRAGGMAGATQERSGGAAGQGGKPPASTGGLAGRDSGQAGVREIEGGALNGSAGSGGAAGGPDTSAAGVAGQGGAADESGGASFGGTKSSGGSTGSGGTGSGGTPGQGGAPSCATTSNRCVKAAPSGWQGPVLVSANSVTCPGAFPTALPTLYSGLSPGAVSCSCSCGAPTTICGGNGNVGFYNDDGCMHGAAGGIPQLGSCVSEPSSTTINYSNKSVNASCSAATVQKTAAPSQWSQTLNVCGGAVQQGTCAASDEICVQNPAQAFAAKYCITSSASQACPAAYPAQSQMFPSYKDLRECPSSCSCTPSGQDCEMQVDVYAQASCVGTKTTKHVTSASDICLISNTASQNSYFPQLVVSNAGTCSFSGALTATGSVAGENPTTVCCTQ